jgi:TnpA family transposase
MKKYGIDWFDCVFELISFFVISTLAVFNLSYIFEWNLDLDKLFLLVVTIMMFNTRMLRTSLIIEKIANKVLVKSDKE